MSIYIADIILLLLHIDKTAAIWNVESTGVPLSVAASCMRVQKQNIARSME